MLLHIIVQKGNKRVTTTAPTSKIFVASIYKQYPYNALEGH